MSSEARQLIHLQDVAKVFITDDMETHALVNVHLDIRQGRPRINPRLAETINKCLNPNPEARPPSFEAVLKMISKVQTEDQPG